ncbi:MAG: aminotransferase class I/II-fold pyridoxal phosphate-dependent enzyme [Defluviitaleaceae bacterium]|nr:aminotransferase class I/II-fold pyridoxal phosphate-dependent enzyme [Defluviitaleaceae bacterium]
MHKEIYAYLSGDIYPFHMPGHKRNPYFFPPGFLAYDLTELPEMDVLSAPRGIIQAFLEKIATGFGAEESFFLVNGASAGIVAALCAVGDVPIYVPRNAHVSVYNGLVFSGARPMYYMPQILDCGLVSGVCASSFKDIPRGSAVFVVSPTYEGFVSNLAEIAQTVHERDGLLIVDEAHGAHFSFHDYFPTSALAQGADIVINSLHKTLPAISGCAVLHVNSGVDKSRIQFFINAMQTTSPSYALMSACDFMLDKLWNNPELFESYVQRLKTIRKELDWALVKEEGQDPSKLLFMRGRAVQTKTSTVEFEMVTERFLLAMTSVADTDDGFSRLKNESAHFSSDYPKSSEISISIPEMALTPREAMSRPAETIPTKDAIGRISAELISEYPPGIAIIAPGEIITSPIKKPHLRVVKV